MVIISWTFFSLLFGTEYTTKYVSKLANPRYSTPVETINDFLEQGFDWGEVGERPGMRSELSGTGKPELIRLVELMRLENNYQERIAKIKSGKYGRFVKVLSKSYITDTETFPQFSKELILMKECILEYYTTFGFQKESPLTDIFNRHISRVIDAGLNQKWFHDMINIQLDYNNQRHFFDSGTEQLTKLHAINLENLIGVFYLLGCGLLIASISFIVELVWKKFEKDKVVRFDYKN